MAKQNCWEYKKCGRQPGGGKADELGVCLASTENRTNGMNSGTNGGRVCWALAGTLCGGKVQGTFAMKLANCMKCDFYQLIGLEEGRNHKTTKEILEALE